jgi:cytosine/adenosine deaminase-related metal-dependent hydrolase
MEQRLSASEVFALTAFALARAARAGITMVVEHLHAPSDVGNALAAQARAAETLGMRLVNSHATKGEPEAVSAEQQVEQNAAYAKAQKRHALARGALGFHASFCSDDELLRRIGRIREELGVGAHFHLAESEEDVASTFTDRGSRIVHRMERFGLLGAGSVCAYARAVDHSESERLAKSRSLIALSPRMNLAAEPVGRGLECILAHQNLIGLGTSGIGSLWDEMSYGFAALLRLARAGRLLDPDERLSQFLIAGPAELCSMIYGAPSGTVEEGCLADLVVYEDVPAKESSGAVGTHILMRLGQTPVAWTIVAGKVLVREGQLLGPDFGALATDAAKVLESVWAKVAPHMATPWPSAQAEPDA